MMLHGKWGGEIFFFVEERKKIENSQRRKPNSLGMFCVLLLAIAVLLRHGFAVDCLSNWHKLTDRVSKKNLEYSANQN